MFIVWRCSVRFYDVVRSRELVSFHLSEDSYGLNNFGPVVSTDFALTTLESDVAMTTGDVRDGDDDVTRAGDDCDVIDDGGGGEMAAASLLLLLLQLQRPSSPLELHAALNK